MSPDLHEGVSRSGQGNGAIGILGLREGNVFFLFAVRDNGSDVFGGLDLANFQDELQRSFTHILGRFSQLQVDFLCLGLLRSGTAASTSPWTAKNPRNGSRALLLEECASVFSEYQPPLLCAHFKIDEPAWTFGQGQIGICGAGAQNDLTGAGCAHSGSSRRQLDGDFLL